MKRGCARIFVRPLTILSKVDCFTLLIVASLLIEMLRCLHKVRIRCTYNSEYSIEYPFTCLEIGFIS